MSPTAANAICVPSGEITGRTMPSVLRGVVDVKSFYMETPEDVAERVRLCLASIPAEKLSLVPDCGFFPVPRWVAAEKLKRLAAGAALARREIGG